MRIAVDTARPLAAEPETGHNRWHPDLRPLATVSPGDEITLETRDGLDGQLHRESVSADIRGLDLGLGHPLTGPLAIEGAVPGDLLEVELVSFETADVGVTAVIPGFGFLADEFPDPYLVVWEIIGGKARAKELPGIAIPGGPVPGSDRSRAVPRADGRNAPARERLEGPWWARGRRLARACRAPERGPGPENDPAARDRR